MPLYEILGGVAIGVAAETEVAETLPRPSGDPLQTCKALVSIFIQQQCTCAEDEE